MADSLSGAPEAPSVNSLDSFIPGSGNPTSTLKPIDPNAKLKLAARDKAADPFSGLEEVKQDAFAGLEEVKSADAFSGLTPADALDLKDTQSLVDDDTFRPADYLASNPNIRTDADKSKKLIDVYRARQIRGLEAGKVLKSAATEAPGIVAKTAKGIRDLGARIIEVGIQPAATSALATITGATPEEKAAIMAEQGKEQLKAAGEVTAGTEAAVTGISQLGQQGIRKLFGKAPEKMTDSELLDQLYLDAEFSKTTKEVAEGRGDVTKAAGLDADTLAKNGVTLDKEAIEHLSLVDPLTLVATAGVFKVVGMGGKVIATAATRAGAQAVITGLSRVAQTVGAKTIQATGQALETAGKVGADVATRLPAKSVGFVIGATKTGTLQGGAVGAAAGEAAKRIGVETAGALSKRGAQIADIGTQLNPSFIGPKTAGLTRLMGLPSSTAGKIATRAAGGALQGAVTAAPLAAAADDSQTAGALLGGGAALGAIHGTVAGAKTAVAETVAKNYLDPHSIPFKPTKSSGYGLDANLDATHDAAIAKLPQHEQNAVNTFREAVRNGGGEIYVQDGGEYLNRIRENLQNENGGQPLTPEQEAQAQLYASTHAFFDGYLTDPKGESRRVVFLNGDSAGLHHDAGHLFQSMLSPEAQASLRESALSSYSKEQIQAFKEEYAKRIGDPDYFQKLGDQADVKAADELIAENFSQLFQNQTLENLSAPRSFLKKLSDTAVQAGEALGFDLTAGRTTADLGAKPSFRLQDLLRNAAQDVLTRKDSGKLTPAEVKPVEPAAPVEVTPEVVKPATESAAPAAVTPEAGTPKTNTPASTEKNIRAERTEQSDFASRRAEETGIAEAQKATESNPEARQVVDTIADSMNKGNPVLEVEHRGIVSERGPANPEGRTSRRSTQEAGIAELERLQIENRADAPADIVDLHQKTFVPVRFTTQGGKPTLIAMSLDKVIANVRRVVKDAVANKAESLLPYPVENGKLTDAGWKQAIADVQAYAENQSNGYRGDGQKLVRPTEDIGVSLPAENPNYTPKTISEGAMNFANLVQGLNPPETGRVQKGLTPGNVKGQILAEVNKKQPMTPAVIKPENVTKQKFKGFEPRTVKETNPLRNELAARGVKVRELTEVTERLAVEDIASVAPRTDINFKAPVTDVIRAGFLPKERPVAEVISAVESKTAEEWNKEFTPEQGLTRTAYETGLNLTKPEDLTLLKEAEARSKAKLPEQMSRVQAGDMAALDEFVAEGTKSQFFREAYEAATDSGSAKGPGGWRAVFPDKTAPFSGAKEGAKFLPEGKVKERLEEMRPDRLFLPASEFKDGLDPIKRAAIRTKGGQIFEGSWHGEAYTNFSDAIARGESKEALPPGFTSLTDYLDAVMEGRDAPVGFIEDGFVTETGKFLNRAEALDHAERIGQMKASTDRRDVSAAGVLESNEFENRRDFLPSNERSLTGQAFKDFFSRASKGEFGKSEVPWVPLTDVSGVKDFWSAVQKHSGNFDEHIAKSIPAYRETQLKKGQALVNMSKDSEEPLRVLDIGGSEGSWDKAVSEQSGGTVHTTVVDPNPTMAKFFHEKSKVPGADYAEAAWLRGFEDEGKTVPKFDSAEKFDAINESMVFQFMSPERAEQIAEAKRLLKPDGLFLTDEKLRTESKEWAANEAKKDAEFKKVYFSDSELAAKDKVVGFQQSKSESKAVGMVDNMVTVEDFEKTLKENFQHVAQYWDSGNFRGYVASDSLPKLQQFLREMGDTKTDFSTVETPRYVGEGADFLPRKRKVEESDVQKRSASKRPVTAESVSAKMQRDVDETDYSKYNIPEEAPKAGPATGWVLPDGKFVPIDANFHEQFLNDNATELNQKFGMKLGETVDVSERLDALNAGFVRMRYIPNTGSMRVELSASHWNPKTKRAVLDQIDAQSDRIDSLYVSLLNKKGGVVDEISQSVVELDGPEKFSALSDAIGKLRSGGAKFLPTKGEADVILKEIQAASPDGEFKLVGSVAKGKEGAKDIDFSVNYGTKFVESEMGHFFSKVAPALEKSGWTIHNDSVRDFAGEPGGQWILTTTSPRGDSVEFFFGGLPEEAPPNSYPGQRAFLPSEEGVLPGLKMPSAERIQQNRIRARVTTAKDKFPEALPPEYAKDENGKFITDFNGKPKPVLSEYRFADTPVAREAAKGIRGPEAREEAVTDALAEKLVKAAKAAQKNPEIQAGSTWYSTARTRLKKLLGNDAKFFSELLGATSARTPVETNFRFSLDAYNQFKRGAYDDILKKYREGKDRWVSGEIGDYVKATKDAEPTRAAFMDWWVQEHDLTPLQSNGKKFAMNSQAVLKVLDGSWATDVQGPKTPNFAGNLSGQTFEATIDVWASRLIHRLANEGNEKPWRILPENETGLSDADFFLGQAIFRKAAEKLGMKPDALQAILWFAEKDHWEKNGWTRGAGAEKSDFNSLLKETELSPEGVLKRKTPQGELGLSEDDIQPKKR